MVVRQSRPSLKGSRISGKRWMSVAAVMRKKAAALESPSSRWRKGKRPEWPSSSQPRRWSNSARAARKSAMAWCSWRRREARRAARARLSVRSMREIIARPISRPVRRAGRPAGARRSRGGRSSRRSPSTWPSRRAARAGAASGGAPGRGRLARPDDVKRNPTEHPRRSPEFTKSERGSRSSTPFGLSASRTTPTHQDELRSRGPRWPRAAAAPSPHRPSMPSPSAPLARSPPGMAAPSIRHAGLKTHHRGAAKYPEAGRPLEIWLHDSVIRDIAGDRESRTAV